MTVKTENTAIIYDLIKETSGKNNNGRMQALGNRCIEAGGQFLKATKEQSEDPVEACNMFINAHNLLVACNELSEYLMRDLEAMAGVSLKNEASAQQSNAFEALIKALDKAAVELQKHDTPDDTVKA